MLIRSAPGTQTVAPHLRRRVRWVVLFIVAALALLVARLWQLQVVRGEEYHQRALSNVVEERRIPPVRGKILDREGVALAENRPAFNIYVKPHIVDGRQKNRLADLLELSADERARASARLRTAWDRGERGSVLLLEDQGRDRASLVAQSRLEFPGVQVRDEPYRTYPKGTMAAHLLGYMNQLTGAELEDKEGRDYVLGDMMGRHGLEKQWESYLRGQSGMEQVVVDASGRRVEDEAIEQTLIEGPKIEPPLPGRNVVLTLDYELQAAAEEAAAQEAAASIAVTEIDSGRILALVSQPSFDPNVMTGHLSRADERRLLADPRRPFVDKTLASHYPPASTFKAFTALAELERDEDASPEEAISCGGYHSLGSHRFHCMGNHGGLDMREALKRSCNVYFYQLGERNGLGRLSDVALSFGFGAPTGLGINADVKGRVPTPAYYRERAGFVAPGHALNVSIGQGDVAVTVIQMAMAYGAIANGGKLYVPQVVGRLESSSGETIVEFEPRLRSELDVSDRSLEVVREGLAMAVAEPGGTGYRGARSEIVEIAGKTGTAQVSSGRGQPEGEYEWHPDRNHSWFVGWAPADEPEIAFSVLIPHGGGGSQAAAPVARDILEAYFADRADISAHVDEQGGGEAEGEGHGGETARAAVRDGDEGARREGGEL